MLVYPWIIHEQTKCSKHDFSFSWLLKIKELFYDIWSHFADEENYFQIEESLEISFLR